MSNSINIEDTFLQPNAESKENSFIKIGNCSELEDIEVKEVKINDIPKERQIRLNKETLFEFFCTIEKDEVVLKLSEISSFAPFIYLKKISLEDFQLMHKMFNSCDNVEDVQRHINTLFKNQKMTLTQENEESLILNISAHNISQEVKIVIPIERKMTTHKDETLMKLYSIEKKEIKLLKEIEKFMKDCQDNNLINKFEEILRKK